MQCLISSSLVVLVWILLKSEFYVKVCVEGITLQIFYCVHILFQTEFFGTYLMCLFTSVGGPLWLMIMCNLEQNELFW
jgi:hypothetical protein